MVLPVPLPFTLPWISQVALGTNGTLEPCAGVQRKSQEQARSLTTHSSRGRHVNLKGGLGTTGLHYTDDGFHHGVEE